MVGEAEYETLRGVVSHCLQFVCRQAISMARGQEPLRATLANSVFNYQWVPKVLRYAQQAWTNVRLGHLGGDEL